MEFEELAGGFVEVFVVEFGDRPTTSTEPPDAIGLPAKKGDCCEYIAVADGEILR